jgi:uncharacterized protein (DUF736 family)
MACFFGPGDRVAFSRDFLRNTGQFTGQDKPAHNGPFARGAVLSWQELSRGGSTLVSVQWDDGHVSNVLAGNLVRVDRLHLERV